MMTEIGWIRLYFLLFLPVLSSAECAYEKNDIHTVYYQPEQIHISYGVKPSEMWITWSTADDTDVSVVQYGRKSFEKFAYGNKTLFIDEGILKKQQYIHRVLLRDLEPGKIYSYRVGSCLGWSELFYFRAMNNDTNWSPRFAVFGDMGNDNAQSLPRLQSETLEGLYDAVLHVGDFAYDMDSENGEIGNQFMRQVEPIAAYLPYMTCPGNHEQAHNFSHYKNRFTMPGSENGLVYSFNIGPIHFIALSTEFYYFLNYGIKQVIKQYEWLEKDLQEANLPENRSQRPWIITFGHRPMYCSNDDHDDCTHRETLVRVGIPYLHWFGLEKMLYEYGVDLEIWAHEHSYERLWPVYDRQVYNGSLEHPYTNPLAPVHITTGSAGCREKHDTFSPALSEWTAFRSTDYGYSRMQVFNKTHLYLEQVSDDKAGEVIDKMWLIKDKHGPYADHLKK